MSYKFLCTPQGISQLKTTWFMGKTILGGIYVTVIAQVD